MKRRLTVALLLVLLVGAIAGLVAYNSRAFWAWMIRRRWGAMNPDARNAVLIDNATLSDLRTWYTSGRPGWTRTP